MATRKMKYLEPTAAAMLAHLNTQVVRQLRAGLEPVVVAPSLLERSKRAVLEDQLLSVEETQTILIEEQ